MTLSSSIDTQPRRVVESGRVVAPLGHDLARPSWQSHLVNFAVRSRMRPHAYRPIDPVWVRTQTGRPRWLRRWLTRVSGITIERVERRGARPSGEWIHRLRPPSLNGADGVTVLYLHGGGFIACSPETHRPLVASLVRRLNARAFVPAYRLAPEHPFPAALEDALAAYRYLLNDCGVAPGRLVLAGDSAGGGLAIATAQSLAAHGLPQPSSIVTFSPWTDLAATGASLEENSERCAMFAAITIRRAAMFYAGRVSPQDPRVSPLYGDFRALAPLLLHVGQDEVLRDDSVRLAERAIAAGATVEFRMWRRVPHCWQFFEAVLPEARESLRDVAHFVTRHLRNADAAPVTFA